jgi:hypothetical protein
MVERAASVGLPRPAAALGNAVLLIIGVPSLFVM